MGEQPPFHLLKPRNTLAFAGAASLVMGLLLGNGVLLTMATLALGALAMGAWQSYGLLGGVTVRRLHPPRAFQGHSVGVALRLENTDRRAPELVLVEDRFPPSAAYRISRLLDTPLRRGRVSEVSFIGACDHRRGPYVLGPARVEAQDSLGLFTREVTVEEFTSLLVYPQAVTLGAHEVLGEGTLAHVGLETTQRAGVSEEFAGLREYQRGDSPRLIDWKSTARHRQLMIKEFQEERTTLVTLLLDNGRQGLVGVGDQTSVEYAIRAAATIARHATGLGHFLQFFAIGDSVEHVPEGNGTAHLLTILDRLAVLRPAGPSAFPVVAGDLTPHLRPGSTAVMIQGATTVNMEETERLTNHLLSRAIKPVFVLVDDRSFIKLFRDQEERHAEALTLDEIMRHLQLMGARVHVLERGGDIGRQLRTGLDMETPR